MAIQAFEEKYVDDGLIFLLDAQGKHLRGAQVPDVSRCPI